VKRIAADRQVGHDDLVAEPIPIDFLITGGAGHGRPILSAGLLDPPADSISAQPWNSDGLFAQLGSAMMATISTESPNRSDVGPLTIQRS
jgi:hypothetical protein